MKPFKYIKYDLVEFNSFIKPPRYMKWYLVMIYIQVHISNSEEIKKHSVFKWIFLVIHKPMSACIIWFYAHN